MNWESWLLSGFLATLALFSFATWAERNQNQGDRQRQLGLQDLELQIAKKLPKPAGFERPVGRSPVMYTP